MAQNQNGSNALHIAVKSNNLEIMETLVNSYNYNLDVQKHNGVTALGVAVHADNKQIVKFLLEAGADPNVAAENGATALFMAVKNKCKTEIIQTLVEQGASIHRMGMNNDT